MPKSGGCRAPFREVGGELDPHLKLWFRVKNKIILKNFRPEMPPSVDRPKIILFQHGTTSKINYFKEFEAVSVFYFNTQPRMK